MKNEAFTIAAHQVVAAGKGMGLKQNMLSAMLGFSDSGSSVTAQESWTGALPALVAPKKYAVILTAEKGSFAKSVNYVCAGKNSVLFNETDQGMLSAIPMPLEQAEAYFTGFVEGAGTKREINLSMSYDAMIALCALADSLYRRSLQVLLDKNFRAVPPSVKELQEKIKELSADTDERWLTDFIFAVYNSDRAVDVNQGIAQLAELGVVALEGEDILPTETGWPFVADFADRRSIIGAQNYFYQGGQPVRNTTVLLRTCDHIWFFDCADISLVASVNSKEATNLIKEALAPGEEIPAYVGEQSPTSSPKVSAAGSRFCSQCGSQLGKEAKFCAKCGTKQ
jgi:hypothetical protein